MGHLILVVAMLLGSAVKDEIFRLLPGDDVPLGWHQAGEERLFVGDELFRHINGGAVVFHQNGFVKLGVKDYLKEELEVTVEIYAMEKFEGAAAIFAINATYSETGDQYGVECSVSDLQILFHRGPYYISVTGFAVNEELHTALGKLAKSTDELIEKTLISKSAAP